MLRVALKDILARKRRLVTTGLAIVLGIAFLTGTQLLSTVLKDSIGSVLSDAYSGYGAVVRSPEVQELGFGQGVHKPVPEGLVGQVSAVSGVAAASGVVETTSAQLIGRNGKIWGSSFGPPTIVYNWISDRGLRLGNLLDGREPTADDEIVLDFSSAKSIRYKIGDTVPVSTYAGVEKFKLVGLVGLGPKGDVSIGATALLFNTPTAQRIGQLPGQFNYIAARAEKGVDQEMLANAISASLPSVQVLTGQQFIKESSNSISKIVDILTTFVSVFGYVALFVACFIIYNTFAILVAQRTRETALLRAIGAKRQQVLAATVLEAALVGLIASIAGLVGGVLLSTALKSVVGGLFRVDTGTPTLSVANVATAFVVGVGVTVLSGFVPAWRASKVPPIAALSEADIDRAGVSRSRVIWGSVLLLVGAGLAVAGFAKVGPSHLVEFGLGAALVLISVSLVLGPLIVAPVSRLLAQVTLRRGSVVSRLAGENASRNPRRTASTAAALTIGVTLVTLIAILASSIRASVDTAVTNSVKADYIISVQGLTLASGIPPNVLKEVKALDDVATASQLRFGPLRLTDRYGRAHQRSDSTDSGIGSIAGAHGTAPPGQDEFMIGMDPRTIGKVFDFGKIRGSISDVGPGTLMVAASTAEKRGWKLGDEIPVYFARTGVQKLKLVATFSAESPMGTYFVSLQTFNDNSLGIFAVDFLIYVSGTKSADGAALRSQLDRVVKDLPSVSVQNVSEYVKAQTAPFDTFLAVVYGLLFLAVIIALIGIANTLSLSVLERTRELGLLRAVGMSRRQLRSSIVGESLIIAIFGTAMGLLLGIVFSGALSTVIAADNPQVFSYTLPVLSLIAIAVVAMVSGVVAALLPAWRASRLDVLDAISAV